MLSIDRSFVTSRKRAQGCARAKGTEIEFHSNFMPVALID